MKHIPFLKPPFDSREINAVIDVMHTAELTNGRKVRQFENNFADYIGTKHAIAVNSGTSALNLILTSLVISDLYDIDFDDKVAIPSFTYPAVANAVVSAGLEPIFLDILPDFTINFNPLEEINIKDKIIMDSKVKAIIAVHTYGMPCMMNELMAIAEENDLLVIEDCAEACGAEYHGKKVGSFGVAGAFSFTPTKNMTTGEGGMVTTDSFELADIIKRLRDNGIVKPFDNYNYRDVIFSGYNMKMSEITAVIGIEQLKKLDDNNKKRVELAKKLNDMLDTDNIIKPLIVDGHVYQQYVIQIKNRDRALHSLRKQGIMAQVYFNPPLHKTQLFNKYLKLSELVNTERASRTVISLPFYPNLTDEEIQYIVDVLRD